MKNKTDFKVSQLSSEILGKLDAHGKIINIEVLASVVRKYISEQITFPEREETIERFCNMLKL